MGQTLKNQSGFTLVELLIALVVFAVGILAVGQMQITAIRYNADARQISEASVHAQSKMEELLDKDYDNIYDGADPKPNGIYSTSWVVVENTPVTGAKEITVNVTWNSHGVSKAITLSCIKAELQ